MTGEGRPHRVARSTAVAIAALVTAVLGLAAPGVAAAAGGPSVTRVSPSNGGDGTLVSVYGSGFAATDTSASPPTNATVVDFGTVPATVQSCTSTQCQVTAPGTNSTGAVVDVTVTVTGVQSAATAADRFTYSGSLGMTEVEEGNWNHDVAPSTQTELPAFAENFGYILGCPSGSGCTTVTLPSTFSQGSDSAYGNTGCSGVSACPAAQAYGVYTYELTPLLGGGLIAGESVTLTAPGGTDFPSTLEDYEVIPYCAWDMYPGTTANRWVCNGFRDLPATQPVGVTGGGTNVVTIELPVETGWSVPQGRTFGIFVANVANPPEGSYVAQSYSSYAATGSAAPSFDSRDDQTSCGGTTSSARTSGPDALCFTNAGAYLPFTSLTASPQTVSVDNSSGATLTATVLDEYGNPVPKDQVQIFAIKGNASPAPGSTVTTTTSTSGQLSEQFTDTVAQNAVFEAEDDSAHFYFGTTPPVTVRFVAGRPAEGAMTTSTPVVAADGTAEALVTVDLADQYGNPDVDQAIALQPASGFRHGTVTPLTPATGTSACAKTSELAPDAGCTSGSGTSIPLTVHGTRETVDVAQAKFYVSDPTAERVTFGIDDLDSYAGGSFATPPFDLTVDFAAGAPAAVQGAGITPATQSVVANGTAAGTLTVTLKDADGNPVSGLGVDLSPSSGTHSVIDPVAVPDTSSGCPASTHAAAGTTNCAGVATFSVTDHVAEAVAYTASYSGSDPLGTPVSGDVVCPTKALGRPVPCTATVDFQAGAATPSSSTVVAEPASALADGTAAPVVTVALRDATGNPAPGRAVTLVPTPGATATVSPVEISDATSGCATQAPAGVTNCKGIAEFASTDSVVQTVTYTADDTTDGVTVSQRATIGFTGTPTSGRSTISAAPTSVVADGSTTSVLTATLRDASGSPVAGKQLCLTQSSGSSATAGPCPPSTGGPSTVTPIAVSTSTCPPAAPGTTDCAGVAEFVVSSTTAERVIYGLVDVTDYPGGPALGPNTSVTFTPVPDEAGESTVSAGQARVLAGSTTTVTVTLRDAGGAPIVGHGVVLSGSPGTSADVTAAEIPDATSGCGSQAPAGTSDCNGQAAFVVGDATAQAVTFTGEDETTTTVLIARTTVTFVPDESAVSTVSAAPGSAVADGTSAIAVTVTLDPTEPLSGDRVSLSQHLSPSGASHAAITPVAIPDATSGCGSQAPAGTSDCRGEVEFSVTDTSVETVDLSAFDTSTGTALDQTAAVTFLPPAPVVDALAPAEGPFGGGTRVVITGSNLTASGGGLPAVDFGAGNAASEVTCTSSTSCTVTAPASAGGAVGSVEVVLTTPSGPSTPAAAGDDLYTYVVPEPVVSSIAPSDGPVSGGTNVVITGTHLGTAATTTVSFGTATVSPATVDQGGTRITVVSPAYECGTAGVSVTTPGGTSAAVAAARFTYTTAACTTTQPTPPAGTGPTGTPPPTSTGKGYWEVASDGGIFAFGTAGFYGSMGGKLLDAPVVGIAAAPTGKGYWEVASDGGIFAFGTAGFYGSMGGKPLDAPVVGIAAAPTGKGYWEVASDGGIFAFGTAGFYGSMGGKPLDAPVVGIAPDPGSRQ